MLFTSCSDNEDSIVKPTIPTITIPSDIAIDSVQIFNQIKSGRSEADRLGLRFSFSDFEPTGIYIKPNSILTLNLQLLEGYMLPEILIGSYSRGDHWNTQPTSLELQSGLNTINVGSEGGMLYIRYTSSDIPNSKAQIKFLDGWEHSALYKLDETSNTLWKKKLDYFKDLPSATLISNNAFLVVSREKALDFQNENQDNLLNSIDEVITIQNEISGMDGSSEIHKPISHKLLMVEYTGDEYYMFAYNFRTAYRNSDAVQYILNTDNFNNDGWGPWHEIGHMHQMNAWTWSEVVESTVNIYSLASEKSRGITTSRYKRENKWAQVETYLALPDAERDFNSSASDVWTRLGMFYQLQLAFGEDFYKELHKNIRTLNPTINSDSDRMRTFMLASCKIANKDLTNFFTKWGLKFDQIEAVYTEINSLNLPAPNSDLTLLRD